ncbi:MAG: tryptophan synthase subunit alpha [Proteobacteria bacterium]|nr:tryptophan synthase subunit alpha [Pseudomonadota bacterium]MDA1331700.1 tryptophan synthase subunit alpha [Pseudomonadota bacterium]
MSRISKKFQELSITGRKALIPFITAGDPDLETTLSLLSALVRSGSDIIELGIPFSDPIADGPTIQRASERALAGGASLSKALDLVQRFRETNQDTPIVLMGYANPIEALGIDQFVGRVVEAGVDGVLVVDYPPEESGPLNVALKERQIDSIFLLAPTTLESRILEVARLATGYVYYVSLKGVTGAGHLDLDDVSMRVREIKKHVKVPVGVGFGIRDGKTASAVAQLSDAVVIGSRLVEEIEKSNPNNVVTNVENFIRSIRVAIDKK